MISPHVIGEAVHTFLRISASIPRVNVPQTGVGAFRAAIVVGTLFCLGGCGKSNPTAPTPSPTPSTPLPGALAAPSSSTFTGLDFANRGVSVAWRPSVGAESYIVEVGSSSGASDIRIVSVPLTSTTITPGVSSGSLETTLSDLPPGIAYFRFKAVNATGVSAASAERWVEVIDIRNVIESLFFFTGPYSLPTQPRNLASRMLGWASGSTVSVRVPNEWGGEQLNAIERSVEQANASVAGTNFVIERASLTESQYNQQLPLGITILRGPSCVQTDGSAAACSLSQGSPVFRTTQMRFPNSASERPDIIAHEFGHALGLSHTFVTARADGSFGLFQNFRLQHTVMGGTCIDVSTGGSVAPGLYCTGTTPVGLSPVEVEAVRRVYEAGLRPGSTAADFLARGLLVP